MRLIFLLFIGCFVFIGCSSPYSVTSSDFFAKEVVKANSEIIEMGYQLSGTETNTKNNLYVKGTSYTPVSGYGTAMGNDFVAIDKYKFTDSKGNTMSYTVSYTVSNTLILGSKGDIRSVTHYVLPRSSHIPHSRGDKSPLRAPCGAGPKV